MNDALDSDLNPHRDPAHCRNRSQPPLKIIGIGHRSRVGKTTVARMLAEILKRQGYVVQVAGFADRLKAVAQLAFSAYGLQRGIWYEQDVEDRNAPLPIIEKSPVQLWIELGNKIRDIYPDVWIDNLLGAPGVDPDHSLEQPNAVLIIPDVRFLNEVLRIQEEGGFLLKVARAQAPLLNSPSDEALTNFDGWDGWLANDFESLDSLNGHVRAVYDHGIAPQLGLRAELPF